MFTPNGAVVVYARKAFYKIRTSVIWIIHAEIKISVTQHFFFPLLTLIRPSLANFPVGDFGRGLQFIIKTGLRKPVYKHCLALAHNF